MVESDKVSFGKGGQKLNIRERIKAARIKRKVSARKLSLALGKWHGYIADMERGRTDAPVSMVYEIARTLGCPVEELVQGEGSKNFLNKGLVDLVARLSQQNAQVALRFSALAGNAQLLRESDTLVLVKGLEWARALIESEGVDNIITIRED
jgi:transcriptional regulator with XRE-family HTH domain